MRKYHLLVNFLLLLTDLLILYLLFRLAINLRNLFVEPGHLRWLMIKPVGYAGLLFEVIIFAFFGLYPGYGLTSVKELEKVSKATILLFLFLAAFSYLNREFQLYSRAFILFSLIPAIVLLPLARFSLRNLISRYNWYGIPVLIYGNGKLADEIARKMRQIRRLGWIPVKVLPLSSIGGEVKENYDLAVIASPSEEGVAARARLLSERFRRVILVEPESKLGTMWVESRDLDGQLALEFNYHLLHPESRAIKNFIDLTASLAFLLLLSPLLFVIAFAIAVDSPGPILFRQRRLGRNFREFNVLKFRTMVSNAEEQLEEHLDNDPEARAEYEQFHKLEDDPRVTRVGKWLRKFSADELPQLINVLRGEMSLVGPRAYMPSELDDMKEFARVILRVKPGMTGWWQVSGRHRTTFQRRLELDDYYISNWSLWMDMFILLKTAWVVVKGKGA